MKKALIITTVSGFVPQFEMNNVKILQGLGYEVHYASNFKDPHYGRDNRRLEGTGIVCHQVDFARSPFHAIQNINAYWQLCRLMGGVPFALVHCHTPVGGALGRLAAEKVRRENGHPLQGKPYAVPARVIYTAHGFHFYKGAPLINWLLYYPIERMLAKATDTLITMNEEDYRRAERFHLRKPKGKKRKVFHVPGVGIDIKGWNTVPVDRKKMRKELGLAEKDFMLLSVGELSKRKNHKMVIKALAEITGKVEHGFPLHCQKGICHKRQKEWHYFIVGDGYMKEHLEALVDKLGLDKIVIFLGYREDIRGLLAAADCFVFPSKQEGLPVALLEAVAAEKLCIASDIRGNRELVDKKWRFPIRNRRKLLKKLLIAKKDVEAGKTGGHDFREMPDKKIKAYDISAVGKTMRKIYRDEVFGNSGH